MNNNDPYPHDLMVTINFSNPDFYTGACTALSNDGVLSQTSGTGGSATFTLGTSGQAPGKSNTIVFDLTTVSAANGSQGPAGSFTISLSGDNVSFPVPSLSV